MRGPEFVTWKITISIARIKKGLLDCVGLWNLDARKDWEYAGDYVNGMWKMLQQESGGEFVLGTGELHTVREFAEEAFKHVNINIIWEEEGVNERGIQMMEKY